MSQNESVQLFQPSAEFVKQATISGMGAYQALCERSQQGLHRLLGAPGPGARDGSSHSRRSSTNRMRRSSSGSPTAS